MSQDPESQAYRLMGGVQDRPDEEIEEDGRIRIRIWGKQCFQNWVTDSKGWGLGEFTVSCLQLNASHRNSNTSNAKGTNLFTSADTGTCSSGRSFCWCACITTSSTSIIVSDIFIVCTFGLHVQSVVGTELVPEIPASRPIVTMKLIWFSFNFFGSICLGN